MAVNNNNSDSQITKDIKEYLKDNLESLSKNLTLEEEQKKIFDTLSIKYVERAAQFIESKISLDYMRNKLNLLFEYEKHYLSLIKEYKEEIKFASTLQEDLRKERANFFSATLKEVYNTLQATKVGPEIEMLWLKNLVSSYTDSLDLSSELAKENTLTRASEIKDEVKRTKEEIES